MSDERVILVEGNDDVHSIIHVLKKRGVFIEGAVTFYDSKGWDSLLAAVPIRFKSSTHTVIGIVADADTSIASRWRDLCDACKPFGFNSLPDAAPPGGLVAANDEGVRLGIWLMPNNLDNGALEDFLLSLVRPEDRVLLKARQVVAGLATDEKHFGGTSELKAVAHTYLSWQEAPGRPLGLAVNFNYFDARADAARSFQEWFDLLTKKRE